MPKFELMVVDYESLSSTDTAVGLNSDKVADLIAEYPIVGAIITVEGNSIRYRLDGTDPTASEGHLADVGDVIELYSRGNLQNFKFISTDAATTAVIKVSYLGGW